MTNKTARPAREGRHKEPVITQLLPVDTLSPNDYNPNRMSEDSFGELVAEIRHLGRLPKPVIVRPNGNGYLIVDGEHGRRAAQEAGLSEIPCEVVEIDEFEARRQTYKRNQHGEHNPVLLGRMFGQMMEQRSLSRRALAKEIDVSEGTIRNALLYADAADMRNRYAEGLEETHQGKTPDDQIAALSVRQVRYYVKIPRVFADRWLNAGADVRALYGAVDTNYTPEELERNVEEQTDQRGPDFIADRLAAIENDGLAEFARGHWNDAEAVQADLDRLGGFARWERQWTWGVTGETLTRAQIRAYSAHYYREQFYVRKADMMTSALNEIIDTSTAPPSFVLTPDEFSKVIEECELVGRQSHEDFMARLQLAVIAKRGEVLNREQGARAKMMLHAIEKEAPEYIRNSKLRIVEDKYLLWKTAGTSGDEDVTEAAKQHLARQDFIRGPGGKYIKDNKKCVAAALEAAEGALEKEKRAEALKQRYANADKQTLASDLAGRLFGNIYKDDESALAKAAARLQRLDRTELFILDEYTAGERWLRDTVAMFQAACG